MKKDKQKIIDHAKTLYIEYDSEGKKVYSLREISAALLQKFNKTFTAPTILNWSKKYGWNILNEKIKQQAILKARDDKFTAEEKIIESESDKLAKDFKNAEILSDNGYDIMFDAYKCKEHELISVKDALTAIRLGTDIKFRIMDIPESLNISIEQITGIEIKK